MKRSFILFCSSFLIWSGIVFTGCEDKSKQTVKVPPKAEKVSRKIVIPKKDDLKKEVKNKKILEVKKNDLKKNPPNKKTEVKTEKIKTKKEQKAEKQAASDKISVEKEKKSEKPALTKAKKTEPSDKNQDKFISNLLNRNLKKQEKLSSIAEDVYNPEGRVDPFNSFIKEKVKVSLKRKKNIQTRPKTPLEKIDIGQLKLAAVLQSSSGNTAILEEGSGKGYVVGKGTYVGLNSGQITEVKSDRILISETIEDITGKSITRVIVLKIQKPVGE